MTLRALATFAFAAYVATSANAISTCGQRGERPAPLPDLAVVGLGWMPDHPKIGDRVLFSARVRNIGKAPTPAGKVCGVAFAIGAGNPMFWSDTYKKSIGPGESVVLTANGGATGSPYWIATGGDKPSGVYANVNDSRRFPESSWMNNIVARYIHVSGSGPRPATLHSHLPDLVVTDFQFIPPHPRFGQSVSALVTIKNQGPASTPKGTPIGVGFYATYLDSVVLYAKGHETGLRPGESATLRTIGGGHVYPWIPFPGRHRITAYVNDIGKIREADGENNLRSKFLYVADPRERTLARLKRTRTILRGVVFGDQHPAEPPWTHRDRAFDEDVDTGPISSSLGAVTLGMDLGAKRHYRVTDIAFYPTPYFENRMIGGKFQGSNVSADDGYVDLSTVILPPKMGWNYVKVFAPKAYRYVRYLAPAKSQGYVHEILFFGRRL